jgi:hypothetical protein
VRWIALALTLLALAAPAAAQGQIVPPGNSGVDQYQESVPGVGGNRPSGPNGGSAAGTGAASGQSRISPKTAQSLDKLGPDGKGTAAVAAATAPGPSQGSRSSGSIGDSGPGMGVALPIILALALAGALAVVLMRRRGRTPPGPA